MDNLFSKALDRPNDKTPLNHSVKDEVIILQWIWPSLNFTNWFAKSIFTHKGMWTQLEAKRWHRPAQSVYGMKIEMWWWLVQ